MTTSLRLCPPSLDLCFTRGDTVQWTFQVVQSDGTTPVDITGFTFALSVAPDPAPADGLSALFTLTGTLLTPLQGIVAFGMSPTESDQVPGVYFYDLQLIDLSLRVRTILKGQFEIEQDVTKV